MAAVDHSTSLDSNYFMRLHCIEDLRVHCTAFGYAGSTEYGLDVGIG
jgi:hypothetical protein